MLVIRLILYFPHISDSCRKVLTFMCTFLVVCQGLWEGVGSCMRVNVLYLSFSFSFFLCLEHIHADTHTFTQNTIVCVCVFVCVRLPNHFCFSIQFLFSILATLTIYIQTHACMYVHSISKL